MSQRRGEEVVQRAGLCRGWGGLGIISERISGKFVLWGYQARRPILWERGRSEREQGRVLAWPLVWDL